MDLHFGGAGHGRPLRASGGLSAALAVGGLLALWAGPALAEDASRPAATIAQIPDPWEGVNRPLFKFSMAVDSAVIAPGVHSYRTHVPGPLQAAIKNWVYNLDEPRVFANDMLQLRFRKAGESTIRFVANSTVGVGGLIDVAGKTGLPGHDSDFGQTLGRWGVGTGPYVFVPLVGATDVRDGIGRLADAIGDPVSWVFGDLRTTFGQVRWSMAASQARVDLDDEIIGLNRDFTDPYATLRSGFSQNRAFKVQEAKGVSAAAQAQELPEFDAPPAAPAKP